MSPVTERYENDLEKYRNLINTDGKTALDQFGLSLLYSVNPAERAKALRDLGYDANSATDFYNIGVHAMQEDNWTEAIVNFKQAIELDASLTDAIYNLAICYEKTGHTPQAIQTFEIFCDVTKSETDKAQVEEHLSEIR